MKRIIKSINYNWFTSNENGEEFTNRNVGSEYYGRLTVSKIEEHNPMGEGDRWFYDIYYSDGSVERVFNPNQVFYYPIN